MKCYIFHVLLHGTGPVWRKIELWADQTLHDLHWLFRMPLHRTMIIIE